MADDGLFKGFEDKKEGKKKMSDDAVEIKIRFKKSWLIHLIYIFIIIILLILLFYNPFASYKCEKGLNELTSEIVGDEPEDDVAEEPDIADEPEDVEEDDEDLEPETEVVLSGKVTLTIDDIELGANKTRVESITIKMDNQKKIFTPSVYVYWYDPDSIESMKSTPKSKITYTGAIPIGVKVWKLDTELTAHYLIAEDDNKEVFKLELYDGSTLLDTKAQTLTTN